MTLSVKKMKKTISIWRSYTPKPTYLNVKFQKFAGNKPPRPSHCGGRSWALLSRSQPYNYPRHYKTHSLAPVIYYCQRVNLGPFLEQFWVARLL